MQTVSMLCGVSPNDMYVLDSASAEFCTVLPSAVKGNTNRKFCIHFGILLRVFLISGLSQRSNI
jgi:hypothetical protein